MPSQPPIEFRVGSEAHGQRLDKVLHRKLPEMSRAFCQKLIRDAQATVNREQSKPSRAVRAGDLVSVTIPETRPLELQPEAMPLDILYEDNDLLVLHKPPGLVVHPAAGHPAHTLVQALLHHCRGQLSGIGGVTRPGIVHRLDRETSGCLLVAKNDGTHRALLAQFQGRDVWKEYLALVWGNPAKSHGRIDAPIGRNPRHRQRMAVHVRGGRPALTEYEVVERFQDCSAVRVVLHTGRTHQIRVHFASLGHPVVGDMMYGRKRRAAVSERVGRQMLHAHRLGFEHPRTRKWLELTAPLPADMKDLLIWLRTQEPQEGKRSAIRRSTA